MALALNGANQWPSGKNLVLFGEKRSVRTRQTLMERMQQVGDALADTAKDVETYQKEHPEFAPIARQMVELWEAGARESLSAGW